MHDAFSNMKNLKEFIFVFCCLRAQSYDRKGGRTIKHLVFTARLSIGISTSLHLKTNSLRPHHSHPHSVTCYKTQTCEQISASSGTGINHFAPNPARYFQARTADSFNPKQNFTLSSLPSLTDSASPAENTRNITSKPPLTIPHIQQPRTPHTPLPQSILAERTQKQKTKRCQHQPPPPPAPPPPPPPTPASNPPAGQLP